MHCSDQSLAWLARRDGSAVIGFGPFESTDAPPDDGVAFHVRAFDGSEMTPWKIPSQIERLDVATLRSRFATTETLDCTWIPPDPTPFSVVFQEIMGTIQSGACEKTVPVVTETGHASTPPKDALVAATTRQPPPLLSYGWAARERGFAGATPELLLSMDGLRLETMALAGTARYEDRAVFAADEKEIREHEYVAQTLVSKLLDLGQLHRHPREILNLGPIVHFLTMIEVDLAAPLSATELLGKLHPTPALGPLPRTDTTMQQLAEWRLRLGCPPTFGAPFGLWDGGRFDAVVAIRGIWWEGNQLAVPAGCGIIEASRLVNEWRELRLKREAVKNFMYGS